MTTTVSDHTDSRVEAATVKAVWTRPTIEVADIEARTQAGGFISADQDPNQTS